MPNIKIYVDQQVFEENRPAFEGALSPLRDAICRLLSVPVPACQLAILPVIGLPDQPLCNLEIQYLGTPARTPEMITSVCEELRDLMQQATGQALAIRATPLDPETYVALK